MEIPVCVYPTIVVTILASLAAEFLVRSAVSYPVSTLKTLYLIIFRFLIHIENSFGRKTNIDIIDESSHKAQETLLQFVRILSTVLIPG